MYLTELGALIEERIQSIRSIVHDKMRERLKEHFGKSRKFQFHDIRILGVSKDGITVGAQVFMPKGHLRNSCRDGIKGKNDIFLMYAYIRDEENNLDIKVSEVGKDLNAPSGEGTFGFEYCTLREGEILEE